MADIKIADMTTDTSISGVEVFPVSDAGAAKKISVSGVKDFTVDAIEAIAAGATIAPTDHVFVLIDGELKPILLSAIMQEAIDDIWENNSGTIADSTKVPAKIGSTESVVTAAELATYFQSKITNAIYNISGLDTATLVTTDFFLVTQGTAPKKTTLSAIVTMIYAGLAAHVVATTAAGSTDDADIFYSVRGTTPMKVTLAQIKAHVGGGVGGTGTADLLAQWSATATLKAGPSIVKSTDSDSTSDTALPTTAFVKGVKLDDFAATDDNTDLDATESKHGLLPKLDKVKLNALVQQTTVDDPAACAAMTATLTGVDTATFMTADQAATITSDLAALKVSTDANRTAILAILSRLETLGLFAAS